MGCDAVGRECLIVSNGWKYFTLNYGRKGGKIKQRCTTRTQYAVIVSGNKWGTIESISVWIYSAQGDIKAVVCLTLCQSHTSMLSRNIGKQHSSNLVSPQAKLSVSAFNWKQQLSSDIFIFLVWLHNTSKFHHKFFHSDFFLKITVFTQLGGKMMEISVLKGQFT